jgi:hypothetical protein
VSLRIAVEKEKGRARARDYGMYYGLARRNVPAGKAVEHGFGRLLDEKGRTVAPPVLL